MVGFCSAFAQPPLCLSSPLPCQSFSAQDSCYLLKQDLGKIVHSDSGAIRLANFVQCLYSQEDFGLELVGLLLLSGSDFQKELIVEELMQVIKGSFGKTLAVA